MSLTLIFCQKVFNQYMYDFYDNLSKFYKLLSGQLKRILVKNSFFYPYHIKEAIFSRLNLRLSQKATLTLHS